MYGYQNRIRSSRRLERECTRNVKFWWLLNQQGSKFKAQNSRKNNYNAKKVQCHLNYIEKKTAEYFELLNELDKEESKEERMLIEAKREHLIAGRKKYEQLEAELENLSEKGELQVSTCDPDARALPLHMGIVEVGYNVQSSVDAEHKMIVDFEVTNKNDTYALSSIAIRSKAILGVESLDVLADKGYHNGIEMQRCCEAGITTYIAPKNNIIT